MNRRTKIGIVIVVFLLLVAAVTVYIVRKPTYDSYEKFSTTLATTITLDLSQGSGTYSSGGTTQPLRVTVTPPTLSEIANSSSSSALVVARIAGGPLGLVPAVVQFNGSALSLWWPVVSPYGVRQQNLLPSVTYTGPGTYSGVSGVSNTLVIGDDFPPAPVGKLTINLDNVSSPIVSFSNNSYTQTFTSNGNVNPVISSFNFTFGEFSSSSPGYIKSMNLLLSNGNLQVVINNSETWLNVPYTGPKTYTGNLLQITINVVLGADFYPPPTQECIGQPDGLVLSEKDEKNFGSILHIPTLIHRACYRGSTVYCENQRYGDGSGCNNALIQSCAEDKNLCNDQRHCSEESGCDNEACISETIGIYNGNFGVPSGNLITELRKYILVKSLNRFNLLRS